MDKTRTLQDIFPLQKRYVVDYDLEERKVVLEDLRFPAGWQPDAGDVLFKLPDDYPKSQPKVYVSGEMRYHGGRPENMYRSRKGWAKWCIHQLKWDRRRHTLVTVTRMLMTSLSDPNADNPVRNAV